MAKEFTFRSYDTNYRYSKDGKKSYIDRPHAACFSTFFNDCGGKRHITIEIHSGLPYLEKTHKDNACLFTKAQMEEHINEAKKLIDFEYVINRKHKLPDGYWGYTIDIVVDGTPVEEKYLVTWIRYLYEFPFNAALIDVFEMKKLPEFSNETVENLMLVVLNCHIVGDGWVRGIHSVPEPRHGNLYTTEELKSVIKSLGTSSNYRVLNSIYPKEMKNLVNLIDGDNVYNLERWKDKEAFKKRVEVYVKVLNDNR